MDARDDIIAKALAELVGCQRAAQRRQVVAVAARQLGVTEATVYRRLKAAGWDSGRRERADKGRSQLGEQELRKVAEVMAKGRNKRGEANVPTRQAVQICQSQGQVGEVSYSQVCRQLRRHGLSGEAMRAPAPSIARVSLHPNHVWFVDVSVAIQWYFRDAEGRRKLALYNDAGARFYEGKRQNLAAVDRVLLRYMAVDHFSGAYYVRYYYSSGEQAVDVVDFLQRAMAPKWDPQAFPLRGVPRRMVVDQGPAFKASVTQGLLGKDGLNVQVELHKTGNAKASGAVESRHNHWQRNFEGRLALRPAEDLEQINYWAERWCALANAETPHTRHGRAPLELWSTIRPEQLIEAPDRDTFLHLATAKLRTGTLTNRLHLRADGRTWELAGATIYPGAKVQFRMAPFADAGIRAWDDNGDELAVTELQFDAISGFQLNGKRHVWDDEAAPGASHKPVPAQKLSAEVAEDRNAVRLDTMFDDLDERLARQTFLSRQGTAWTPAATATVAAPLLGSVEARERVAAVLGRPLSRDEGAWWRERIGDGCTQADLDQALEEFLHGQAVPDLAERIG